MVLHRPELLVFVFILVWSRASAAESALLCRICSEVQNLEQCSGYRPCSSAEQCFMEEIVTINGRTVFNGGCRSNEVCAASVNFGRKRTLGLVACSRCCDQEDLCNDNLCGLPQLTQINTTRCYSCGDDTPSVSSPELCRHLTVCQPDEMCFAAQETLDGETLRHVTRCASQKLCLPLMHAILGISEEEPARGDRETVQGCSACCNDDNCNKQSCQDVRKYMSKLQEAGLLDKNTLKDTSKSRK